MNVERLSNDQYIELLTQINKLLTGLVESENSLMRSGVFRAFDFQECARSIALLKDQAQSIQSTINRFSAQIDGRGAILAALAFIDILVACCSQLELISAKLAGKARGESYGFFSYRRDMKEYRRLEEIRISIGERLQMEVAAKW